MTFSSFSHVYSRSGLAGLALGTTLLMGCGQISPEGMRSGATSTGAEGPALAELDQTLDNSAPESAESMADSTSAPSSSAAKAAPEADIGQLAPQLVKQASLVLVLNDVDQAVTIAQTIVQQAQGDVLNLQDYRSPEGAAHQISLTVRVPQAQLETVLTALRPLGTVMQQSLTAEDVSTQMVDVEARLRNLRQSETALLKIMDRSGEISHVLEVARELSTVRESIERLTAQQQNLKRQVAYAQIQLTLESPVAEVLPLRPVGETLGNTWQAATQSVRAFTMGGLKISLWLLAYSPYLGILAALVYGGYRFRRGVAHPPTSSEHSS